MVVSDLLISQKLPKEKKTQPVCEGLEIATGLPGDSSFRHPFSSVRVELPAPPHRKQPALGHGGLASSVQRHK